jgi:hypothetical protein
MSFQEEILVYLSCSHVRSSDFPSCIMIDDESISRMDRQRWATPAGRPDLGCRGILIFATSIIPPHVDACGLYCPFGELASYGMVSRDCAVSGFRASHGTNRDYSSLTCCCISIYRCVCMSELAMFPSGWCQMLSICFSTVSCDSAPR